MTDVITSLQVILTCLMCLFSNYERVCVKWADNCLYCPFFSLSVVCFLRVTWLSNSPIIALNFCKKHEDIKSCPFFVFTIRMLLITRLCEFRLSNKQMLLDVGCQVLLCVAPISNRLKVSKLTKKCLLRGWILKIYWKWVFE